jgi:1-acyl-sn-glycerol-3-phosphate acyltransferase
LKKSKAAGRQKNRKKSQNDAGLPPELKKLEEEICQSVREELELHWKSHGRIPECSEEQLEELVSHMVRELDPLIRENDWFDTIVNRMKSCAGTLFPAAAPSGASKPAGKPEDLYKQFFNLLFFFIREFAPKKMSEVDEFGFDEEYTKRFYPFFDFMYSVYWRVTVKGIENVPGDGKGLLVANHSGVIPWDSTMLIMAILKEHENPRFVRCLMLDMFTSSPFLGTFFCRTGQVRASQENGIQLLKHDNLVAVFPEGLKGIGKLFSQRYKLQRFGRGGFIKLALETGSPVIPVSIIGAEEIYPLMYRADWLAKLFNFPYFPITLTFPWFGMLGLVPLPTKWIIEFGTPLDMRAYGKRHVEDELLVQELSDSVKETIQRMIYKNLKERNSVFLG